MTFQKNPQLNQTPPPPLSPSTTPPPSPSTTPPPQPQFRNQSPFPATIDVNRHLCHPLSSLSLNTTTDRQTFFPSSLDPIYGGVNAVNYNNRVYSGVGHPSSVTVDPHLLQHYNYGYPSTSGASTSRSNFDQRSYLFHKYNNYCDVSNKNKKTESLSCMSLKQLEGAIYSLAKDRNGCRILLSKFENPTEEEIEIVMCDVMGSVADLMQDHFGNIVIQKLITVCNNNQLTFIVRELTANSTDIILVSMTPYGSRSVQKLLANLKTWNQTMMVFFALQRGAAILANDPNGHHVIMHCLLYFDNNFNQLILNEIAENCYKVATDKNGCCVLQVCVEYCHGEARNRIISEILTNALHFAEDPFGNYVLQHMMGLKSPELTWLVVRQLRGNFANLSQDKYASNVVQKCLTKSGPDISNKIVFELVGSQNPSSLLVHPFGNYVIQSALQVSKGLANECLHKLISRNSWSMESNVYGKKILEKIGKRRNTNI